MQVEGLKDSIRETPIQVAERSSWIDYAKVIGIWLVVYGHTPGHYFVHWIFIFHMPLWFILSGYLYKPRNFQAELKRTIPVLVIPYVLYNIIIAPPQLFDY